MLLMKVNDSNAMKSNKKKRFKKECTGRNGSTKNL